MTTNAIKFNLKDGRSAVIRNPKEEDAQGLTDCLRVSAGETYYTECYPEDYDEYTEEIEKKAYICKINAANNEAMLVCLVDGEIAGNCHISWSNRPGTRHRASVGIALLKEFWGQGIEIRLCQELIRIAEANENITQIELGVIEGDTRANLLYDKMGFKMTGNLIQNALRLPDGAMLDEFMLVRRIQR